MGSVIILVGVGHLGGPILDRLAAARGVDRIVAVSRDRRSGEARCNLARLTAAAGGRVAPVQHRVLDVTEAGEVGALVCEVRPDLVVHAASLQTWWLLDLFPEIARAPLLEAGYGVWLPLHLKLALDLMRGLQEAGYDGLVINAAYPDVINVVLAAAGLAPTAGVGNVDELAAKARLSAARKLGVEIAAVEVRLIAHHALQRFCFRSRGDEGTPDRIDAGGEEIPPFRLVIESDGVGPGEQAEIAAELLRPCVLPVGPAWGNLSAASAVSTIEKLLGSRACRAHCPGPLGMPGGYPVIIGNGQVALNLPDGMTTAEAVEINERSHRFDGIDGIGEDGSVAFAEDSVTVMRDTLGFDCRALRVQDVEPRAIELGARFREYARRHGVGLGGVRAPAT